MRAGYDAFRANMGEVLQGRFGGSMSAMGRELGVARKTLYSYVEGTREPRLSMLRKIRAALGCTWDELLEPRRRRDAAGSHVEPI